LPFWFWDGAQKQVSSFSQAVAIAPLNIKSSPLENELQR
jgi:hypothetical protein